MENIPLFEAELCHVFRIPGGDTLKSELWEGNHIWSGSVRVFQDRIELFDSNGLFGACPLRDDPDAPIPVKPTTDSRRCFVVRVEQGGLFAYLGINFETHGIAFQFHTAVLERHRTASNREGATVEVHDRRLNAGEKFAVDLAGKIRHGPQSNVVSQKIEDYAVPVPAAAPTTFNFSSGLATRTGASRRVAAPGGESAPSASQSQTQQPPAKPAEAVKPPPRDILGELDAAPAAPPKQAPGAAKPYDPFAPDPQPQPQPQYGRPAANAEFDPFAPSAPAAAAQSQQRPAKTADPFDALFS
jgi:hypothetical protein